LWSREKRLEARERRRRRLKTPATGGTDSAGRERAPSRLGPADAAALGAGPHGATAREAIVDRDDILRLVHELPTSERNSVGDVPDTAEKLAATVLSLATRLADLERSAGGTSLQGIDREIATLEAQANPLDRDASEARVRRLALLRRQRRAAAEVVRQRDELSAKLDSCALLLKNMKFDVLRLRAGDQSWQHVTALAAQAMEVAREVDNAIYVNDELRRLAASPTQSRAVRGAS
jgi:serine/threonine-protein kinase